MLTSIISAVVILGTLVLIHEAGHFAVAKRCGVRVLRFSIGYPPNFLASAAVKPNTLSGDPLGGYVRMLGDEIGDELGSSDIAVYLTEVARDLVQAAENTAAVEPELRGVAAANGQSEGHGPDGRLRRAGAGRRRIKG